MDSGRMEANSEKTPKVLVLPSLLSNLSSFSTRRLRWSFHFFLLCSVFFGAFAADVRVSSRYYQDVGGTYSKNHTLFFQDGPYRATKNLVVQAGAKLTIEQGVKIYFDQGVGIVVQGILHAVGSWYVPIQFLPSRSPANDEHEVEFPNYRLVDGPTTRQGRLETYYNGRWRAVCTRNTNWTDVEYAVACRTMGFSGGGFWRWYRRNNDTYPLAMPRPGCRASMTSLTQCLNWTDSMIGLGEFLCQGEDDLGLICWGPPTFQGWQFHWRGVEFVNAPWSEVPADPDDIALRRQSKSRLEWVHIHYAGYNKETENSTAAIYVQGIPPVINFVNVLYSARDGIRIIEPDGPVEITNCTINWNRGHGVVIENTTDGRVFINETRIQFNWGDGIQYSVRTRVGYSALLDRFSYDTVSYYEPEFPELNFCKDHQLAGKRRHFPHVVAAQLSNGTLLANDSSFPCFMKLSLPPKLPYTYTIQFLDIRNYNPRRLGTRTYVQICDNYVNGCAAPRYKIPLYDNVMIPSVDAINTAAGLWLGLKHEGAPNGLLYGDIRLVMKIHASVKDQVIYGLNVSNSRITHNWGKGIYLANVRDRTVINNVTIMYNRHLAGVHVLGGAGDIWINNSYIENNLGDGVNISYCGGSTIVNSTSISNNTLRGIAFHYNDSYPFLPVKQEIVIKGRPSNNNDYKPTLINNNFWGGILVGNFCAHPLNPVAYPKVIVNYVELIGNKYHPAFEYHSCRRDDQPYVTTVEFSGSRCQYSTGFCVRIQPAVNIQLNINDNIFFNNERSVLIVRNKGFPQLAHLPALVSITRNQMKFNSGPFIVNIGLNDGSSVQTMHFNLQNEIRENTVYNPFPFLTARHQPYAALVVSSSNVLIRRNCFNNPRAEYEIATDLDEHYRVIDAEENNWGGSDPSIFMYKIFDQFKRYTLAAIDVDPYMAICNAQTPRVTQLFSFYRQFRKPELPNVLGGIVYENTDLSAGEYIVVDDLHVAPGATLNLAPAVTFKFKDSIGLLVQGELLRASYPNSQQQASDPILFTRTAWEPPTVPNIRLVSMDPLQPKGMPATEGRLEVLIDDQWGTVCNRSWNVDLASLACNQLGMIIDPEFLENWVSYVPPGDLPIIMDIVRCEEWETDLTRCRHDTPWETRNNSCKPYDIVGLRCIELHWAGVRYSLLANPPTVTGQSSIRNLIIEKAGLLDYAVPEFIAALQIDWNCHLFQDLTVRDNFWNGVDIIYNDLVRKPKITTSRFERNRRHGVRLRSVGLTMEYVVVADNENAGILYNPIVSAKEQRDVYTWIHRPDAITSNVHIIPDANLDEVRLTPALREQRQFLVTKEVGECKNATIERPCSYMLRVVASGGQVGVESRIGVQIISRPSNTSDENMIFIDGSKQRSWDMRKDLIYFPVVTQLNTLTIEYKRSYGPASIVVLLLFLDYYQLVDTFIHMRYSRIENNQYAVATLHYSNFTHDDGSIINRHLREQLWFRRTNFTRNREAVIWVNGPLRDFNKDSPIAEIEYYIDNCSVSLNNGSIIETHRDLYSSANVFLWKVWRSNFVRNANSGFSVALPDIFNQFIPNIHRFEVIENEFIENSRFEFVLSGYYAWVNVSSNNFTSNAARVDGNGGILKITGMEKELIMVRNRFNFNWGKYMIFYDVRSQSINTSFIPAEIRYNYVTDNYYLLRLEEPLVDNWPRSFACGVVGLHKVNVNYNNFRNDLMDFEMVVGLKGSQLTDTMNITFNYWGKLTAAEIDNRIFDFDDWNIYSVSNFSPYYVTEERSINFEWRAEDAQTANYVYEEPSEDDLHGRVFKSVTLTRRRDKWPVYPFYYKPDKPYRIRKDLTIMPGATLTIEKGVEVHIYPNVRILVLGTLIAEGTFYEPIRLKPINITEWLEINVNKTVQIQQLLRQQQQQQKTISVSATSIPRSLLKRQADLFALKHRLKRDVIYQQFPMLHRYDGFFQKFDSFLVGGPDSRSGFVEIYNKTTGEFVPLCDRQFTKRNAEVVCRELGFETRNAYVWIGPRYDHDPKLRIIKSYSEPRQCTGDERRLDMCDLRLQGDLQLWQCSDAEHYVFVHCAAFRSSDDIYIGEWGGVILSATSLDAASATLPGSSIGLSTQKNSILRHVEIVGAGYAHNDSYASALTTVFQTPVLDHVNVTNSSMHGVHIIAPRQSVELTKMNVTFNHGVGLNILTLNLQSQTSSNEPLTNVTVPYNLFGFVDMCSVGKDVHVESRVLVYYKYDSYTVDCVKFFTSVGGIKPIGFKLLQANFYSTNDPTARPDGLTFYNGRNVSLSTVIGKLRYDTTGPDLGRSFQSQGPTLAVHWKANAADGSYGFIAEVVTLPAPPDLANIRQVAVKNSRFERNDRGAFNYYSMGEVNPDLFVDQCYFGRNGYHVWGNFTTSESAVRLDLHNTQNMKFQNSVLYRNQGGLRISAGSTSASARLEGVVKNCAFANNQYAETMRLEGRDYQLIYVLNNYFGKNWAPYHDTVFVNRILVNFTHNIFYNNTGLHIVDLTGYRQVATEFQTFYNNFLYDNLAMGHGYQFGVKYGYFPDGDVGYVYREQKRKKRQTQENADIVFLNNPFDRPPAEDLVPSPGQFPADGTSFEWWANVGLETERYRSTILAGTGQQHYEMNFFNNPLNDFELTTVTSSPYDAYVGAVIARYNYWGYPGTLAVAAGRIRDGHDSGFLINVDYIPVLESNTTLMDGFCLPGWFRAGTEDWKSFQSCFLYVPGVTTFKEANRFCKDQDAYMPFFRVNDRRLPGVAKKVEEMSRKYILPYERYMPYDANRDVSFWISGVSVPPEQCGYLSSRTGEIGHYNCEDLLPFICEKGPGPYGEPVFWTPAGIAALVIGLILLFVIGVFVILWYMKSRRRTKEFFERKNSLRNSIRSNKIAAEKQEASKRQLEKEKKSRPPSQAQLGNRSPDLVKEAHRKLVLAGSKHSLVADTSIRATKPSSPSSRTQASSKTSLNSSPTTTYLASTRPPTTATTTTTDESTRKKVSTPSGSTSAYKSDYSPSETRTTPTSYLSSGYDYNKSAPSLSSFKSPVDSSKSMTSISSLLTSLSPRKATITADAATEVRMRPKSMFGRRGDRTSDATTMTATGTTATCSTCQTDRGTVVSYDPSATEEETENRTTYRSSVDSEQATITRASAASSGQSRDSTLTEGSEVTTGADDDTDDASQCSTCMVDAQPASSNRTPEKRASPAVPDQRMHRGKYYTRATSISSDSTPTSAVGRVIGSDSVIGNENTGEYSQESPSLAASVRHFEQRVNGSPRRQDNNVPASNRATGAVPEQKKMGILTASQDSLLTSSTSSYVASPVPPLPPPPSYRSFSHLNYVSTPGSAGSPKRTVNGGGNWKSPSMVPNLSSFSRSSNYYEYRDESDEKDKPLPLETAM